MKNYAIGLITGILLTASALMFMGASKETFGRYDLELTNNAKYMLNTSNGILYQEKKGKVVILPDKSLRETVNWVQVGGDFEK